VPRASAHSSAIRCTAAVSGKIESSSEGYVAAIVCTLAPNASASCATSNSRPSPGPPPFSATTVSPSRSATDGPCRSCSADSPSVAT
jgi:hypothetical protein